MSLSPGARLGAYKVTALIGDRGMGSVDTTGRERLAPMTERHPSWTFRASQIDHVKMFGPDPYAAGAWNKQVPISETYR